MCNYPVEDIVSIGDQKYGLRGRGKQICLWAYSLGIVHPITKEKMEFTCLPQKIGSWKILEDVDEHSL